MSADLIALLPFLLAVVILLAIVALANEAQKQNQHSSIQRSHKRSASQQARSSASQPRKADHAPSHNSQRLRNKLFLLLHYNTAAADRLLTHARRSYPGKSDAWYYEKVIYDLERDRRG